jgi:hypothetical protein
LNANKVAATPKAIFVFVNIIWFDPRFKALGVENKFVFIQQNSFVICNNTSKVSLIQVLTRFFYG